MRAGRGFPSSRRNTSFCCHAPVYVPPAIRDTPIQVVRSCTPCYPRHSTSVKRYRDAGKVHGFLARRWTCPVTIFRSSRGLDSRTGCQIRQSGEVSQSLALPGCVRLLLASTSGVSQSGVSATHAFTTRLHMSALPFAHGAPPISGTPWHEGSVLTW